jgi:predicted restriction endonuclease
LAFEKGATMNDSKKPSLTEQNRKLKEKLIEANKKIEAQSQFIQRLCQTVGYDRLANEWDKKKYLNRWVEDWLKPVSDRINANFNKPVTGLFRNEVMQIAEAVIMQLAIAGKYGIKLPLDPRPGDFEIWQQKSINQIIKEYPPCAICGETRITHQCHIIPRAHGGKYHRDNLLDMCPLHHHLFDHGRLTKEEWEKLENALEGKMEAAIQYINTIQLNLQKYFWHEIPNAVYPDFSKIKKEIP